MKYLFLIIAMFSFNTFAQDKESLKFMPQWQLHTQDGKLVKSSDYAGKPLILHFWATWCPYCKKLQPGLDRIEKKYAKDGLTLLAVSFNENEGAKPQDALIDRNLGIKTVVNGDELARTFNIVGTPTTFFIAPDGRIIATSMQSDPDDPQLDKAAAYLVHLKAKSDAALEH